MKRYQFSRTALGIVMLFFLFFVSSCDTLKKVGLGKKEDMTNSSQAIISAMEQKAVKADWFNAKARISFKNSDMSVSGSATIRMKTDSILWVSVKKLGFEVARAMITTDSVYIIDRFNREYAIYDLDYLKESYQLPGDFKLLQSVLFGQAYFFEPRKATLEENDDLFIVKDGSMQHQLAYQVDPKDYRVLQLDYQAAFSQQKLKVELEEYDEIKDKQLFSYFRRMSMTDPEDGPTDVSIKFSQIELDTPRDTDFRIPSRYTRMDD